MNPHKHIIDISGPEGNAFYILGVASKLCKELSLPAFKEKEILDEMKGSDYYSLCETFIKHFGDYVELLNHPMEDAREKDTYED